MVYKCLPYSVFKILFGDRKKYGLRVDSNDEDFKQWQRHCLEFYNYQKKNVGYVVNHFGYSIVKNIDLENKIVLEVGPGIIEHLSYAHGKPKQYIVADVNAGLLDESEKQLKDFGINDIRKLHVQGISLPLEDNSVDIVLTFNQLEHIYELEKYLRELKRVLKPEGLLVGAIPTEGGIAWGLGRFFTTRRYVLKNMNFDYDKIICWEHPNFIDKIKQALDLTFSSVESLKKPFFFFPMDLNVSWSFIYRNTKDGSLTP